jgi:electron transport complex protein RnfB
MSPTGLQLMVAAAALGVPALAGGAWLARVEARHRTARAARQRALAERIDALLPQTQCRQCQFEGCRPYAEALARGEAEVDRCPPGGDAGAARLARLLGREPRPVDPRYGVHEQRQVAWIDEERCIGCAKCLPACPVDAIVGAARHTHTVIELQCTGCKLCLPPCPVDCIELRTPAGNPAPAERRAA